MADVFTIPIEDVATVDGTANVKVAVTTGDYYLRVSPFSSNTYTGTHLSKGVWSFGDVNDGIYQLWDASSQIANYGEFYIGDNNPTFSALTMTGAIAMGSNKLTGLAAGSTAGDSVRYEQVPKLSENNTFSGLNIFSNTLTASGNVSIGGSLNMTSGAITNLLDPSSAQEAATKKYVDDQVASLAITPYQNSANVVRLIPRGTQQTNQVYTTWGAAQNNANSFAASTRPMTVMVEGTTAGGSFIDADNGAIPGLNTFNSYVSVTSLSQKFIINIDQDESLTVNNCILTNLYLKHDDGSLGSTPNFNGFVFNNCYIDIVSCSTFTFTNCEFRGHCTIKCSSGTVTYTSCKGGVVVTNTTLPATIVGFDNLTLGNI